MIHHLRSAFPLRQIVIYAHPLVGIDESRLTKFLARHTGLSVVRTAPVMPISKLDRALSSSPFRRETQKKLIGKFANQAAAQVAEFANFEAILIAGGDQWSGRELGLSMFGTITAIHSINPNLYAFPFSLKSSLLGLYTKPTLQSYFGMLRQPLIARDSTTKSLLDQLDIPVVQGADCVFSLRGQATGIPPATGRDSSRILYVVKGQEPLLAEALKGLLDEGINVELLTTCHEEDRRVYEPLAARFGLVYHQPATWQEIVAEFKSCSLVVTNRLHGLILGSLAGAPLLPVTDRKKAWAFANDTEIPHSAERARNVTPQLINKAVSDRDLIRSKVDQYLHACLSIPYSPI